MHELRYCIRILFLYIPTTELENRQQLMGEIGPFLLTSSLLVERLYIERNKQTSKKRQKQGNKIMFFSYSFSINST